jgi:hypothetical protein
MALLRLESPRRTRIDVQTDTMIVKIALIGSIAFFTTVLVPEVPAG